LYQPAQLEHFERDRRELVEPVRGQHFPEHFVLVLTDLHWQVHQE